MVGVTRRGALLGAGMAALAGCGRARGADELSLWAMDVEGANAKYVLPRYERASGLTVKVQELPWTAAHQKLLTAYAGETMPDVTMMSNAWMGEFAMIGAVAPLPAAAAPLLEDQYPGVLAGVSVEGRPRALPWTVDTAVQYYRRDLLAEVGYDAPPLAMYPWRDMLRALKRRRPDSFGVLMQLNWPDHLLHLALQGGEPLLRDRQAFGNFRSPWFREALAFYKSLFDEGLAPKVSGIEASDPPGELARGYVAVYSAGSWIKAELQRRPKELAPDKWGVAPMVGRDGPGVTVVAGSGLGLTPGTRDPERALGLADFLTSRETQLRFYQVCGALPSRPSAWADPVLSGDPIMRVFAGQLTKAIKLPDVVEAPRINTEVQLVAERCVRGQLTVDQAVVEMDRAADALLEKRRWLLDKGRLVARSDERPGGLLA